GHHHRGTGRSQRDADRSSRRPGHLQPPRPPLPAAHHPQTARRPARRPRPLAQQQGVPPRARRIRKETLMTAWLTQIIPDYRNDQVRSDLRDVIAMHKRVMTLIPDGLGDQARRQAGVLYRIDESARGTRILIQTRIPPDLSRLPAGYGPAETRELGPLLAWL